jgi:hypothetical protein
MQCSQPVRWLGWAYSLKKIKDVEEHGAMMLLMAKEHFEAKYGYLPTKVIRQETGLGGILLLVGPIGKRPKDNASGR